MTPPSESWHEVKKRQYEELSDMCQNAAEQAVEILRMMLEHHLLSSLLLSDGCCIQELLQVFLLVRHKGNSGPCLEQTRVCMRAYQSMPQVGWTKRISPEITALLKEAGVLEMEPRDSGDQETERGGGFQLFLQNTTIAGATGTLPVEEGSLPDAEL